MRRKVPPSFFGLLHRDKDKTPGAWLDFSFAIGNCTQTCTCLGPENLECGETRWGCMRSRDSCAQREDGYFECVQRLRVQNFVLSNCYRYSKSDIINYKLLLTIRICQACFSSFRSDQVDNISFQFLLPGAQDNDISAFHLFPSPFRIPKVISKLSWN